MRFGIDDYRNVAVQNTKSIKWNRDRERYMKINRMAKQYIYSAQLRKRNIQKK